MVEGPHEDYIEVGIDLKVPHQTINEWMDRPGLTHEELKVSVIRRLYRFQFKSERWDLLPSEERGSKRRIFGLFAEVEYEYIRRCWERSTGKTAPRPPEPPRVNPSDYLSGEEEKRIVEKMFQDELDQDFRSRFGKP